MPKKGKSQTNIDPSGLQLVGWSLLNGLSGKRSKSSIHYRSPLFAHTTLCGRVIPNLGPAGIYLYQRQFLDPASSANCFDCLSRVGRHPRDGKAREGTPGAPPSD
jgi:hypothetical protein